MGVAAVTISEDPNRMLRVSEAAELLGVSDKTVRKYVYQGKLPAFKLAGGSNLRCRYADVLALLTPLNPHDVPDSDDDSED